MQDILKRHTFGCIGKGQKVYDVFDFLKKEIYTLFISPMFVKNLVYTVLYCIVIQKNQQQENENMYISTKNSYFSYIDYIDRLYSPIQTGGLVA